MDKKTKIGIMLSEIAFANMPLLLKVSGMDFFMVDNEHGGFDYGDLSKIITCAKLVGIKVIIRISDNSRKDIIKFMDMGANGLLMPMANTADDVKQLVSFAKYAPLGKRGISTMRAHTLYNPSKLTDYMRYANDNTYLFAQIETVQAYKNLKEIASVEGLGGLIVGPNDLSCDMGELENQNSDKVKAVITKTAEECKKNGIKSGIITINENYIESAKKGGMDWLCIGSELSVLKSGFSATVKKYS